MLFQELTLKFKEVFALTMFKLLAKEVFMREVLYEMPAMCTSYRPAMTRVHLLYEVSVAKILVHLAGTGCFI